MTQQINVLVDQQGSTRWNSEVVPSLVAGLIGEASTTNDFLNRCGIKAESGPDGVEIKFTPEPRLRINESVVARMVVSAVEHLMVERRIEGLELSVDESSGRRR